MNIIRNLLLSLLPYTLVASDEAMSPACREWAGQKQLSIAAGDAKQGADIWFVPDRSALKPNGGWFGDHVWRAISGVDFVFLDGSGDAPQAPTTVKMLTCQGMVYLRIECDDPDAQHVVYSSTGRNSSELWRDDCVEMFLRAGEDHGKDDCHIIVNPAGALYTGGIDDDPKWDPPIRSQARILQHGWRADIAFPMRALTPEGDLPLNWRGNISRSRKGREGALAEETGWRSTGELRTNIAPKYGFCYFEAVEKGISSPDLASFRQPGQDLLAIAGSEDEACDILRGLFSVPAAVVPIRRMKDDSKRAHSILPMWRIDDDHNQGGATTKVEILRSENELCVSFTCHEPSMDSLVTGESDLWRNDSVELFLAPGRRESNDYWQVIVTASGQSISHQGAKGPPLEGLTASVEKNETEWIASVTVPLAAFGTPNGKVPAVWGFNAVRNRPTRSGDPAQTLAWAQPGQWSVHDPARFGALWLEGADLLPVLGTNEELSLAATRGSELRATKPAPRLEQQYDWNVLSDAEKNAIDLTGQVNKHLRNLVGEEFAERDRKWNAATDWDAWGKLKAETRAEFWRSLGLPPQQKFPLNPRTSLVYEDDEVVCERLIYESRPRFYVSANFFAPKSQAGKKAPAVVFIEGHSTAGRMTELRNAEDLARSGYAVLLLDLIGQGERVDLNQGFGKTTDMHYAVGSACVLTSSNLAQYMVYDIMRGLDYLETRSEVDMSRIALTGASGGGTLTAYTAALEDRIAAAAPVSALGTTRGGSGGNSDAEQVLYRGQQWGGDCEGFLSLIAPRPAIVICEVASDEQKAANLASYDVARRIYAFKDVGDKLEYVATAGPHGYGQTHFRPFKEWLLRTLPRNEGTPELSSKRAKIPRDQYNASKAGNVFYSRELSEAQTIFDLNTASIDLPLSFAFGVESKDDAEQRSRQILAKLRELLVLPERDATPIKAASKAVESFDEFTVEKLLLQAEVGIELPVVFVKAHGREKTAAVIWLNEHGKREALQSRWREIRRLLDTGISVLIPDLRGTGEADIDNDHTFLGADAEMTGFGYKAGHPLIGQRVFDALSCAAWLRTRKDIDPARIGIVGDSLSDFNPAQIRQPRLVTDPGLEPLTQARTLGPTVAMLAFALDDKLACCAVHRGLASYASICAQPYAMHMWSIFVPGILKACDIADIYAACAPRPLLVAESVNALNQRLDKAGEAAAGFPLVRRIYELRAAPSAVAIRQSADCDSCIGFISDHLRSP